MYKLYLRLLAYFSAISFRVRGKTNTIFTLPRFAQHGVAIRTLCVARGAK